MAKTRPASPFLKWAGGKKRLLPQLDPLFPVKWQRHHEPFLGGGAVFFHPAAAGPCGAARLSDINAELVMCYAAAKDDVEAVIRALRTHAKADDKSHHYGVRAAEPARLSPAERAARLIYLNKTCFNGLYRVNASGSFNVPMGSYKNPEVCVEANLRAASRALTDTGLVIVPFSEVYRTAEPGDVVYLDPPYVPISTTSSFTSYVTTPFGEKEQSELPGLFGRLAERGCRRLRRLTPIGS